MSKEKEFHAEITLSKDELGIYTIHDLVKNLTEELHLTPEQQFRVTAKIKRYVHSEKAGVYSRLKWYFDELSPHNKEFLDTKVKTHRDLEKAPDEEVVTWSVGTHKYSQKRS